MKILSIAFDLEMFFFPVLVNFGVSKKKKDGKNFTDFARARELQKERERFKTARIARNTSLSLSARKLLRTHSLILPVFYLVRSRERKITINFSKSFRFLKSFCGEEREREREKGVPRIEKWPHQDEDEEKAPRWERERREEENDSVLRGALWRRGVASCTRNRTKTNSRLEGLDVLRLRPGMEISNYSRTFRTPGEAVRPRLRRRLALGLRC